MDVGLCDQTTLDLFVFAFSHFTIFVSLFTTMMLVTPLKFSFGIIFGIVRLL
jgi:hypothetical protein